MNDFQYYFTLGWVVLCVVVLALVCVYLYFSRKYKGDSWAQEILTFTVANTLLIFTAVFMCIMEILYKYSH